ncbi:tetratricopeptide repeat protein [Uliginosibacterium sp. 31-12]|uniref:tetratricopeptide repeat protein n=1 Tax=Uliginosibacterium sp. 31-12 TaxID=3062781 RepID=UPI0026E48D9A|nr:tetratricopeptide repeat protein [Uliginosibacterium sp. 31-12]MDO6385648.1 tetratricopeptide repeat protein [Uliginosibacterium sp. 31-12]
MKPIKSRKPAVAAPRPSKQDALAAPWFAQALQRHRAGDLGAAEPLYQQALKLAPKHFDALHMLGVLHAQRGEPALAAPLITQALQQQAHDVAALNNLAGVLNLLHRFEEALDCFDRLLTLQPDNADAHTSRADALRGLERHAESLAAAHQALKLKPNLLRARIAQANALRRLNRFEEALTSLDRVLELRADYPEALNDRANVLFDLRRFDEALHALDAALALRPGYADALFNRANCLRASGRCEDALAAYDALLLLQPAHAEALNNRGAACETLGRFEEAIASYQRAREVEPQHVMAHLNEGLCHLLRGDLERGWPLYQWRWQAPEARLNDRPLPAPRWDGQTSLAGRSILLLSEQGLGDCLQFCRYARQLEALGARVILETWPPLARLLARAEGVAEIALRDEVRPTPDYCVPLLDLPGLLGSTLENLPPPAPLTADLTRRQYWRDMLGKIAASQHPRIGLVFSGNPRHSNDHKRSIALAKLQTLLEHPANWLCLQPEIRESDLPAFAISGLSDLRTELTDFEETAALISELDLVITVDSSVAHLAASLGCPTWLMLPAKPDWRWLLGRADSPWYPSMRLFRQTVPDDWSGVIEEISAILPSFIAELRPPAAAAS